MFFVPLGQRKDDARLIVTQILMMQTAHYFILGVLFAVIGLIAGVQPTIEQFFSYKAITIFTRIGLVTSLCWILNGFVGVMLCFFIIQRAAKCLDHTITMYIVHFCLSLFYKGFPVYWEWWVVMIFNMVITAVLGEYLCFRIESRDIPLPAPSTTGGSGGTSMLEDDEDTASSTDQPNNPV